MHKWPVVWYLPMAPFTYFCLVKCMMGTTSSSLNCKLVCEVYFFVFVLRVLMTQLTGINRKVLPYLVMKLLYTNVSFMTKPTYLRWKHNSKGPTVVSTQWRCNRNQFWTNQTIYCHFVGNEQNNVKEKRSLFRNYYLCILLYPFFFHFPVNEWQTTHTPFSIGSIQHCISITYINFITL